MITNIFAFDEHGNLLQIDDIMSRRPSDYTDYVKGSIQISIIDGKLTASVDDNGEFIEITKSILVDNFVTNRKYNVGIRSTIVFPFSLDDASKLVSGNVFELEDVVYDFDRETYHTILSETPVTSIKANYPYIYMPNSTYLTLNLAPGEKIQLVPTYEVEIPMSTSSGDWIIHGTYKHLVTADLPHWNPDDSVYYGYAARDGAGEKAGDFSRNTATAYTRPLRMYFERLSPVPTSDSTPVPTRGITILDGYDDKLN